MIRHVIVSPPISHTKIKKESKALRHSRSHSLKTIGRLMSNLLKWVTIIVLFIIGMGNIIRLMIYAQYKIKLIIGILLIIYLQCVIILLVNGDLDSILND